ncbi:23S rRNA (adenine(2058)-N(6))-methyltransferase Erm(O) [Planomonospora parontospora subsp. antibiotica]|nr:ErmE/ErmH/ErmO/ErmR family 23S rRNA (adenine(2058)-N(6))-methyltransferase [Planomonospora parontospora]GGL54719.1 23S rRNA (adenine(2058)-N(6))-methyltransferase Erm(O) [Planomonospora parontospora subsp. antibiotica]GII19755.1 23S rRNA (adenine(2058)-N(6))-methyltransferase Erm(O) [Planomonospora parontospora subsp. antibiotica]
MAQSFAHGNHSHTQRAVRNGGGRTGGRTARDRDRRVLSQNLLADPDAVARVVEAAGPHDLVLEPGAGEGVLTQALAETCGQVVGYEIDPLLAGKLAARTSCDERIRVVRGDFLAARAPREPFAVAGNIHYGITSKIVDWCLRAPALTSATLVTQLEYARKRTGDFGRWSMLTVRTWPWYRWELLDGIGREAFRPVPAVDSAILRIERRTVAPGQAALGQAPPDLPGYRDFVEYGFTGLGGSLHATLRLRHPADRVEAAFATAGVAPDAVVAHVHPDRWRVLYEHLHR